MSVVDGVCGGCVYCVCKVFGIGVNLIGWLCGLVCCVV